MTGTRVYQVKTLHHHIPLVLHNMFGKTLLCIYDDQPINQQRKTKTTYRYRTPTYTNTNDKYLTESENDDENQDSWSRIRKTATKPNQQETKNQQPIMDSQQNIEKIIRQTNITTRKVRKMQ